MGVSIASHDWVTLALGPNADGHAVRSQQATDRMEVVLDSAARSEDEIAAAEAEQAVERNPEVRRAVAVDVTLDQRVAVEMAVAQ